MVSVRIEEDRVRIGRRFTVVLQRTLRIPEDGKAYPLPPGLGAFKMRRTKDYADRVPEGWRERGGAFLGMQQGEALWIAFEGAWWKPNAVKVGVGGVDAITGRSWDEGLRANPQNYVVCPDQPWLDGINAGGGRVRQFVAMPLGWGATIEGQVTGSEVFGGIQIRAYEPRPGRFPDRAPRSGGYGREAGMESVGRGMGLAAGGSIQQKIYPDPHGLETWDPENFGEITVHIANTAQYRVITGEEPPPSPVSARDYAAAGLPWFELYDEDRGTLPDAPALARVEGVRSRSREHGEFDVGPSPRSAALSVRKLRMPKGSARALERAGSRTGPAIVSEGVRIRSGREGSSRRAGSQREGRAMAKQSNREGSDIVERCLAYVPDLDRLYDRLENQPHEFLSHAFGSPSQGDRGRKSPGLESMVVRPAGGGEIEVAIAGVQDAMARTAKRAIGKIRERGREADISPDEQVGLEAIILLTGRPAILIQDGVFMPPPPEWAELEAQRDQIQATFRSVGRIEVEGHPALDWVGTGFLVGEDVVMTNRHVAVEFARQSGRGWVFEPGMKPRIDYAEDLNATRPAEFKLLEVLGIHDSLDLALFRVATKAAGLKTPKPLPIASEGAPR